MKAIYNIFLIVLAAFLFWSCDKEEVSPFIGEAGINFTSQGYNLGDIAYNQNDPDNPDQMDYTSNFLSHYQKGQFDDKYDTVYVQAKLEGILQERALRVNLSYKSVDGYDTPNLILSKDSVIKAGEYLVRIAVLIERPAAYNIEYRAQITFDYANSDVVPGSEERQSIILKTSDTYEINYENMFVSDEAEWNSCYESVLGKYSPERVRFILSVFKGETTMLYMRTNYYKAGFENRMDELREALAEYNSTHDDILKEVDGTPITF